MQYSPGSIGLSGPLGTGLGGSGRGSYGSSPGFVSTKPHLGFKDINGRESGWLACVPVSGAVVDGDLDVAV